MISGILCYSLIRLIPEQFTVKAQQPLLGVKKRRRRGGGGGGGGGGEKIFSSENLMSCPELYSQVKSDNNFFLAGILGARSQFLKDFFRTFLFSSGNLESCPELYSKVKSDKKNYFFDEDFLDFFIFVGKSLF